MFCKRFTHVAHVGAAGGGEALYQPLLALELIKNMGATNSRVSVYKIATCLVEVGENLLALLLDGAIDQVNSFGRQEVLFLLRQIRQRRLHVGSHG